MRRLFEDSGHLIRPALVLLAALGVFLLIRAAVVPAAFGQYGHYRPAALGLNRQHALAYAGQQECVMCHEEEATARQAGAHTHVACEACHGPLAAHAADPSSLTPKLPVAADLCHRCHEKDSAKPDWFPQIVTTLHYGPNCTDCHQPHNPKL